jgi:hypothetical protein
MNGDRLLKSSTVGTTVKKWHCLCMMEDGAELYLAIKGTSEAEASDNVHRSYEKVEYVLDILTPLQMEYRKRHLSPGIRAGIGQVI